MTSPLLTSVDPIEDGWYFGLWTGHTLKFKMKDGRELQADTTIGVRGINVPVCFYVEENRIDDAKIHHIKNIVENTFGG